jgi:hypothetical protein
MKSLKKKTTTFTRATGSLIQAPDALPFEQHWRTKEFARTLLSEMLSNIFAFSLAYSCCSLSAQYLSSSVHASVGPACAN